MGREIPEQIPRVVGFNLMRLRQGKRLRGKRWTQADAAKRLKVSVRQVQRWEAGVNMTIVHAAQLARFYGVPTWQLFSLPSTNSRWMWRQPGRPRKALVATRGGAVVVRGAVEGDPEGER